MRRRLVGALAAGLVLSLGASGCDLSGGVAGLTLPGGADVGDSPYTLKAQFSDVLDLVPQSSVKVDNVAVGRVQSIALDQGGHSATVTMTMREGLQLPVGTTARLQQTSLLGEKYVALVRPGDTSEAAPGAAVPAAETGSETGSDTGSGSYLEDGDTLPLDATSQAVGVEQVLGALSLLLNGGGLGQFQEISRELQQVSTGRPEEIRAFLEQTKVFVGQLDERRDSIITAIDGLAQLSATLQGETPKIERALDGLEPGLAVLADQREQLVTMLEALDKLSEVSVRTLDRAQDDIVADLRQLDPILRGLAQAGDDLPHALEILFTYPFPDSVLGAIRGDYLNVFATMNLSTPGSVLLQPGSTGLTTVPQGLKVPSATTTSAPPLLLPPTTSVTPGLPTPTLTTSGTPTPSSTPSSSSQSPSGTPSRTPSSSQSTSGSPSPSGSDSSTPTPSTSDSSDPSPSDSGSPSGSSSSTPGQSGAP